MSAVRVVVRVKSDSSTSVVDSSNSEVRVASQSKVATFSVDSVFPAGEPQASLFDAVGDPLVEKCLAGFNCTLLAYGQTGAGKTFTLFGPNGGDPTMFDAMTRGLVPRILDAVVTRTANTETKIGCSVCELYNEELFDLIGDGEGGALKIREDRFSGRGIFVEGLKVVPLVDVESVRQVLVTCYKRKHSGKTMMNRFSSRSHTIVQLHLERQVSPGVALRSILFMVDLAGSERVSKTAASGQRLREAQSINLSLTLLSNVISKVVDGAVHIPYRDSKLTRLLQDSLGGNSFTTLVCNVSDAAENAQETVQTLAFATASRRMKNAPVVNRELGEAEAKRALSAALEEIRFLKEELSQRESVARIPAGADNTEVIEGLIQERRCEREEKILLAAEVNRLTGELESEAMRGSQLRLSLAAATTALQAAKEAESASLGRERTLLERLRRDSLRDNRSTSVQVDLLSQAELDSLKEKVAELQNSLKGRGLLYDQEHIQLENRLLHQENRQNGIRLLEFAKKLDAQEILLQTLQREKERLCSEIERAPLSAELKFKLLGPRFAKSVVRSRILECLSSDHDVE